MESGGLLAVAHSEVLDPADVLLVVALVEGQRLLLGGTVDVGLVLQQLLDACQQGLDGHVRLPVLLLVQDAQADRARGVDVGVGQHWFEHALGGTNSGAAYRMG